MLLEAEQKKSVMMANTVSVGSVGMCEQVCVTVSHSVCLIIMHRVSVLSRRLSLHAMLQGRVIDYWLEQAGTRGAAGAPTRER